MDHALDDELRAEFEPVLSDIAAFLKQRYGDGVFVRIAPAIQPWNPALRLEAYAPNTSTAAIEIDLDRANGLYITFGNGIDCVLTEQHGWDDDATRAVKQRLAQVCDGGIELWRDRRRHLFGGRNIARVVGEPFPDDVTSKHARRLTLAETTESWTVPGSHLAPDPVDDAGQSAFLVDERLPDALLLIANETRARFGSAVSIVTRTDAINQPPLIEILPTDERAASVRVQALDGDKVGIGAGQHQYFEYEFTERRVDDAARWLVEVGQYGLLEAVRGKTVYYFINHAATPEAIKAVEADSKVTFSEISPPWA
ncbi:hypothetical protein [Pseudolysinimonas sp.]|jgi:hypothetical protein|uniref:hypothetical protein n=1 Tax=Pseudolysinimonas sp. TaxID=2680009 RepID=UPI0037842D0D